MINVNGSMDLIHLIDRGTQTDEGALQDPMHMPSVCFNIHLRKRTKSQALYGDILTRKMHRG